MVFMRSMNLLQGLYGLKERGNQISCSTWNNRATPGPAIDPHRFTWNKTTRMAHLAPATNPRITALAALPTAPKLVAVSPMDRTELAGRAQPQRRKGDTA